MAANNRVAYGEIYWQRYVTDRNLNEDEMTGFVGKRILITAALALAAASAAQAGGECDEYAKLTLQQAKENVDKRCNFKGARWSLDANKHRAWCKEVGPAEWRDELKVRNNMLAGCKG